MFCSKHHGSTAISTLLCALSFMAPMAATQAATNSTKSVADATVMLRLTNPQTAPRLDEAVFIPLADLGQTAKAWQVKDAQGQLIASQTVDRDGDGSTDHLLLLLPTLAQSLQLTLTPNEQAQTGRKRTHAEISVKTGGQWQGPRYQGGKFTAVTSVTPPPQYTDHSEYIRYEGPGIESDRVAYRIYLDWRNGFDIYGNVTGSPVLQQVGLDGYESYHTMQSWGLDLLKVGQSLGTGGFGFWDGKQVQPVADVQQHSATILADGELFSAFSIDYQGWRLPAKQVRDSKAPGGVRQVAPPAGVSIKPQQLDVHAYYSTVAGSRLVRNQLTIKAQGAAYQRQPDLLPAMAIGLVKNAQAELITGSLESSGHQYTYLATWGKQSLNNDDLGMAVLIKRAAVQQVSADANSHVLVVKPTANQLDYYFLATWSGEPGGITSKAEFIKYLQQEADRLTMPARQQLSNPATRAALAPPLTAERVLWWSKQMADAALADQASHYYWGGWDTERQKPVTFEYTTGLLLQALDDLQQVAPNTAYRQAIDRMVDSFITPTGQIQSYNRKAFNIDSINSGNLLLRVYQQRLQQTSSPLPPAALAKALGQLRQQLAEHPRTSNGGFWHKKIYPSQIWLDGVYMGMPFLVRYAKQFEQGATRQASIREATHEFLLVQQLLRAADSGLYHHGWDESKQAPWANPTTGLSPEVWGRGMGWLGMALVDVLAELPADHPDRPALVRMSQQLADALLKIQDSTGIWWNLPHKAGQAGNYLESSSSAMFVYFLAKGLNDGVLPAEPRYRQAAIRGFEGLLQQTVVIDHRGKMQLTQLIQVAGLSNGRDGSAAYYAAEPVYRNDSKGTAPFIMAGVQLARLLATAK